MLAAADKAGFAFDTIHFPLNVMDAHFKSFEKKVLAVAIQKGLGILHMKPLGGGFNTIDSSRVNISTAPPNIPIGGTTLRSKYLDPQNAPSVATLTA